MRVAAASVDDIVRAAGVAKGRVYLYFATKDTDFTALGDTVNIAARLGSLAAPGELLVSRATWDRAGLGRPRAEREVEIAGRTGTLTVVATGAALESVASAPVAG